MAAIRISQNSVGRIAVACTDHTRDVRRCVSSSYAFAAGLVRGSVARAGNSRRRLGRSRIESPSFLARRAGVAMNVRNRELVPSFSRPPSRVMIRKVARYEEDLLAIIHESLREFSLHVKDKTVLLKPNLVGHDPDGYINTHPAVIAATRETFLKLGAARVLIGDGPALDRDTQAILESVRLLEFTGKLGRDFCDLNIDDVERVLLETRASLLKELYLPKTVLGADFFVS